MAMLFTKGTETRLVQDDDRRSLQVRLLAAGWTPYQITFVGQDVPTLRRQRVTPGSQEYRQVLVGASLEGDV